MRTVIQAIRAALYLPFELAQLIGLPSPLLMALLRFLMLLDRPLRRFLLPPR